MLVTQRPADHYHLLVTTVHSSSSSSSGERSGEHYHLLLLHLVVGVSEGAIIIRIEKMELKKVMKDKKFWFASFLITWAAALQGHMMWLQRQDSFKQKFSNLDDDDDQTQTVNDTPQSS